MDINKYILIKGVHIFMNIAFYVSGKAQRLKQIITESDESILKTISIIISDCYNQELEHLSNQYNLNCEFVELSLQGGGGKKI